MAGQGLHTEGEESEADSLLVSMISTSADDWSSMTAVSSVLSVTPNTFKPSTTPLSDMFTLCVSVRVLLVNTSVSPRIPE